MQQVIKRIRLLAIYLALLLPVIVYGAVFALESSNNSPIDWVDSSFSERKHYDEFVEMFGPGDVVIASWPECYWSDERLDKLVKALRDSRTFRDSDGASFFHQVACGREMLLRMAKPQESTFAPTSMSEKESDPLPQKGQPPFRTDSELPDASESSARTERPRMPLATAIQRLQGTMIGRDGRTTCVVVTLNSTGMAVRASIVDNFRRAIRVCCDVVDEDIHLAGPVIDGVTTDLASHQSLTKFAAPSSIVIFIICWWSLRSLLCGVVVFLAASLCQCALLAVIYYTGEQLSALLIILPPLVQVLTISGGIHLMNYYHASLEFLPPKEAAVDAFRKGWLPTVLSLGTTAMGTGSLMVSGLQPIRLFGVYGTLGVLMTTAIVLTVIPCSMILLGRRGRNHGSTGDSSQAEDSLTVSREPTTADGWQRLASGLNRRNRLWLTFLLGLMFMGAAGLPALQTSIRIETLFPSESRVMQDYRWLEDHLGPLVPIEVLVTFSDEASLNDRQQMDIVWRLNKTLLKQAHVHSTTSALTFFPPLPPMKSLPATMRAAIVNKAIYSAKPGFEQAGMLRRTGDGEVWRITAHVNALDPLDYGDILSHVRAAIDEELKESADDSKGRILITTTGVMPLVHQIQGQLLSDLFHSLRSALRVITVTRTIGEAGLLNGFVAMLSNLFPIIIAFGFMSWLRHPMDIGSVMTASVALGIAVDDTLHFLTFFRRSLSEPGTTRLSAVVDAYRHCGRAMIQTSFSCGLGLLVFAFSDFVPTSRFAILITILLMLALLGDLILLPTLLLSPAGRLFEPHRNSVRGSNAPALSDSHNSDPEEPFSTDFEDRSEIPRLQHQDK